MVEIDADTRSEEPFNYTYDTKLQWLEKNKQWEQVNSVNIVSSNDGVYLLPHVAQFQCSLPVLLVRT